jgi:hypothetical protein
VRAEYAAGLDRKALFDAWAPPEGAWTPWAKAVLFANDHATSDETIPLPNMGWQRRDLLGLPAGASTYRSMSPVESLAILVDLPGVESVAAGLVLAGFGFRPVPLFNALAAPFAVVPTLPIVRALVTGMPSLLERPVALSAPPAFLLDARRHRRGRRSISHHLRRLYRRVHSGRFPAGL